jgi:hypothetical protein
MGALESSWPIQLFPEANLANIYLTPYTLEPSFQKEVVDYKMGIPDTLTSIGTLRAVPADNLSEVLIEGPANLSSQLEADRTATITVHSSDQSTQKNYLVLFQLRSIDASLSKLEVISGVLEPSFDPQHLRYVDTLPYGTTETPEVTYTTAHENASVIVTPAKNVTSTRWSQRTTKVTVTAEMGTPSKIYTVEFVVSPVTAIQEADSTPLVSLYPNPTNSLLTIETAISDLFIIEITSLNGQQIHIGEMEGTSHDIDLSTFQKGIYIITIRSRDFVTTKKIFKL